MLRWCVWLTFYEIRFSVFDGDIIYARRCERGQLRSRTCFLFFLFSAYSLFPLLCFIARSSHVLYPLGLGLYLYAHMHSSVGLFARIRTYNVQFLSTRPFATVVSFCTYLLVPFSFAVTIIVPLLSFVYHRSTEVIFI